MVKKYQAKGEVEQSPYKVWAARLPVLERRRIPHPAVDHLLPVADSGIMADIFGPITKDEVLLPRNMKQATD